ncbi:zinc finger protein 395b isoform X1 [Corythoichthys intestinalis]|uniref:zinc finger protein 395b isoform X1 n=1 Tax=Corythoichthys intestinalis TaxID=161448 RepID=UPI0025A5DB12|nr:zinc finger protein 395b isoform X1 [Corythoichthys intestinalis]
MAAMGSKDGAESKPGGTAAGLQACITNMHANNRPDMQQHTMIYTQNCVQESFVERNAHKTQTLHLPSELEQGWCVVPPTLQTRTPAIDPCMVSTREPPYSFRSPESVEMDEIMAAMVLTSLSCNPVVQSPQQTETGTVGSSSSAEMECGGGELSDSGSSGYWSWDHGNVSPAPSPSVPEIDSSPDDGMHMELEQGEELHAKKPKSSFKGLYKCLWPNCGKVLTSSVGIKRHIRVLHLGSGSDQSQREEDFYYTKISCEAVDTSTVLVPAQQALGQASPLNWATCNSPTGSAVQIPPGHRPRSNSSSGLVSSRPSPLSQSAPSSFWQIHTEHLYQACNPVQAPLAPKSPGCHTLTTTAVASSHNNTQMVKPRCRSVSVGEQWLQQNRLQTMSASPSRTHCSFRKGRGEAKKCRKVYGVERKDQWCTACRWKKACQRFPD